MRDGLVILEDPLQCNQIHQLGDFKSPQVLNASTLPPLVIVALDGL